MNGTEQAFLDRQTLLRARHLELGRFASAFLGSGVFVRGYGREK
jgi:hypothetical protein